MRRRDLPLRAAGLVLTGEMAVHELRYLLAPEPQGDHGYLPLLAILSVAVLGAGAVQLATVLERARRTGTRERAGLPLRAAWPALAVAIVVLFGVQEAVEAAVGGAVGPGVLLAGYASGGWLALPLAVAISGVLALALTGAGAAVAAAARAARDSVTGRPPVSRRLPASALLGSGRPLALNLAGRGPPDALLTV